jgi:hypothetical protein
MKSFNTRGRIGGTMMRAVLAMALAAPLTAGAFAQSRSQAFPYGRELRLDADPIRGSKKVPILDIGDNGNADIDLWCDNVRAQLIVAGNTLTIIAGARSSRPCGPDLNQPIPSRPCAEIATAKAGKPRARAGM